MIRFKYSETPFEDAIEIANILSNHTNGNGDELITINHGICITKCCGEHHSMAWVEYEGMAFFKGIIEDNGDEAILSCDATFFHIDMKVVLEKAYNFGTVKNDADKKGNYGPWDDAFKIATITQLESHNDPHIEIRRRYH